jgi:hypothetical protein
MEFDYDSSVRSDIPAAHRDYWQKLAKPGNWWSGAQRIAIAGTSRDAVNCELSKQRREALSRNTVKGEYLDNHNAKAVLPAEAIDAVHRIVTDQTRISASYVQSNADNGLAKPAYIELVGIVVTVLSIDEFHRALGLPLEPLPEPVEGEPDHYLPAQAVEGTGFVPMIPPDGATGKEADLWGPKGSANVVRALSVVPNAVRDWIQVGNVQYLSFAGMGNFDQPEGRVLNRMQIELVAARVSSMNECFY